MKKSKDKFRVIKKETFVKGQETMCLLKIGKNEKEKISEKREEKEKEKKRKQRKKERKTEKNYTHKI